MTTPRFELSQLLVNPRHVSIFDHKQWRSLTHQAYRSGLMVRVLLLLREAGLEEQIPEPLQWKYQSAYKVYLAHQRDVLREVVHIRSALKPLGLEPTFLKGTAYILNQDRAMLGRLFSDIDVLVPCSSIDGAEQMLQCNGWAYHPMTAYDERYYRRWSHELPPMIHRKRGMTLDLHHNLIPVLSRYRLNSAFEYTPEVAAQAQGYTFSAADRFIHSAVHLFLDGEFNNGFRDLSDLQLLLNQFDQQVPDFQACVVGRAAELGLADVLYWAAVMMTEFFSDQHGKELMQRLDQFEPGPIRKSVLRWCFIKALSPLDSTENPGVGLARLVLYIRHHWLNMPLYRLLPHLLYKAVISPLEERKLKKMADA